MNYFLCPICILIVVMNFTQGHYTQQFAVHIEGGSAVADAVATDHGFVNEGQILEDYYLFSHNGIQKRSLLLSMEKKTELAVDIRVRWAQQQKVKRRVKRDYRIKISDPKWPSMWYLNRGPGLDMNVVPAWLAGITGKGAVVTILDDGLEREHPDLIQNYDPMASYDVNGHDPDPSPRYDMIDSNRHGTRCAGEVAAAGNNSICALGIAYGALVGGVRMLDGDVTDAVEARSLSLNPHHIDIYSASWGPDDDGKTVDGPGELAMRAFMEGAAKGRSGKGSIFVWASGNGGRDHDNCNCDGYTNSIYTLSISSATEHGNVPWYSEACSSTLASTYSSGSVGERQIVTTDLRYSCTSSHTGTSASAPLAAGICALALEANPNLTWRDMQHIVIQTAKSDNLYAPDWHPNGVGRNVSHNFGYGLMDAFAMVKLAKKWVSVPDQHKCEIIAPQGEKPIPAKSAIVLELVVKECEGVEVLEHVQAKLTLYSQRRGDLNIRLISPMGTKVTLLAHRVLDTSRAGFNQWPFMSVHSWGESPFGTWHLEIHNDGRLLGRATLQTWSLILYGTKSFVPLSNNISNKIKGNRGFAATKKHNKKLKNKQDSNVDVKINVNSSKSQNTSVKNYALSKPLSKKVFPKTTKNVLTNFRSTNSSKYNLKQKSASQHVQRSKNVTALTPVILSPKNSSSTREYLSTSQKLKDKSRGINLTRKLKVCAVNSKESPSNNKTTPVLMGKSLSANFSAWNLTLYGTATPPSVKMSASPSFDSNSLGTIPNQVNVQNTKFVLTVDDTSSGCVKPSGRLSLALCLVVILMYSKCISEDSVCVLVLYCIQFLPIRFIYRQFLCAVKRFRKKNYIATSPVRVLDGRGAKYTSFSNHILILYCKIFCPIISMLQNTPICTLNFKLTVSSNTRPHNNILFDIYTLCLRTARL